ncbi:hypothetical protein [Pseudonocardia sp. McavD-2-B]|uniref:hypothetical protein n=1 Tax=Pseudonocardia sp. McavD-2-B TaxID=2954499 RepID=UPI002097058F|nr:hypothetical protein [Pseudonocardia sp. McavD-2-B]MCO7191824.1 hypothetical protein [Pseudonocardia sp. McavD-2-B]
MTATWCWERRSRNYGNFGNANQWTVNAGLSSLARESTQNSADARIDTPAELVFTFIRLDGSRRRDFENAVGWDVLGTHLRSMGGESSGAVTAGQIRAGLEAVEEQDSLVLLRVADYGCRGLTGPEFPEDGVPSSEYGNFIKLCRLDLFSGKDEASGGSFGLGKAVYWRFSRLQTVLFNSVLSEDDAVAGLRRNRLFGVNQGVVHTTDGVGYQGRGYFGDPVDDDGVASIWGDERLAHKLYLDRRDPRPGTSALLLGFYDPDRPDLGGGELADLARELREGIEENFWPLLARGGMRVRIEIEDGPHREEIHVDPEETYTELVRALRRFDEGDIDEVLDEPYSVVVRDVPIDISRRRTGTRHNRFTHTAKLVVTASDKQRDSLENKVCLFRRPEMVVQTIDRAFESQTYHAFLVAGAAIDPDSPATEDIHADDFLRFSEPPAHDRWIPGPRGKQASQANLTAHYVAPWVPNLRKIERAVLDELLLLFGAPPPPAGKAPESVMRHLRFLRGDPGGKGGGVSAPRKPDTQLVEWTVVDGCWDVHFEVKARNRAEGWSMRPRLALAGFDGGLDTVDWASLDVVDGGGEIVDGELRLAGKDRGRFVKVVLRGRSTAELPIPAEESGVDVVLRGTGPLVDGEEGTR